MKPSETNNPTRLHHIYVASEKAIAFTQGKSRAALDEDEVLALALVRLLGIIGEAASQITPAFREAHPEIPWGKMTGMRNRVIHAYFDVDLDIVWDTIQTELPGLVAAIKLLLDDMGDAN